MDTNLDINSSDSDLLELIKCILGCTYMSDLRFEPYNTVSRLILRQLNLRKYSSKHINDVFEYIYSKKNK